MKDDSGFTYIGLLAVIVVIGIMTSVIGQTWKSMAQVEKEKELIWRGNQFRNAIQNYYNLGAIHGNPTYPADLKDLLKDPRTAGTRRYIRRIYVDPITGKDDWVPILSNDRIVGVRSASDGAPLKRDNFEPADESFRGKTRYSEWTFQAAAAAGQPTTPPTTP